MRIRLTFLSFGYFGKRPSFFKLTAAIFRWTAALQGDMEL